jgi:hypothetical protein
MWFHKNAAKKVKSKPIGRTWVKWKK